MIQFFENKKESPNRLIEALKGRPFCPGEKEREEIMQRVSKLRDKVKVFRLKYKIEDPPEHTAAKIKERIVPL